MRKILKVLTQLILVGIILLLMIDTKTDKIEAKLGKEIKVADITNFYNKYTNNGAKKVYTGPGQCAGFAWTVFEALYGVSNFGFWDNGNHYNTYGNIYRVDSVTSSKNLESLLSKAKPGDLICYSKGPYGTGNEHSMVFISNNTTYIRVLDGNWDRANGIVLNRKMNKSEFTNRLDAGKGSTRVTLFRYNPSSFKLDVTSVNLKIGETKQLNIKDIGSGNGNYTITSFSSNKTAIATISTTGNIIAKAPGTATITVKVGNKSANVNVTVIDSNIKVEAIDLKANLTVVEIGKSIQITPVYKPSNSYEDINSWSSSDSSIADVDSNGKVTGKSEGSVTITSTSKSNIVSKIEITVKKTITPEKPIIKVEWSSNSTAKVSWNRANNSDSYRVEYRVGSGSWNKSVDYKPSNNNITYTSTGMSEGTKYTFRVKAINSTYKTESGWAEFSYIHTKQAQQNTVVKTPKTPTGLKITWTNSTTAKVAWDIVDDATTYEVEYKVGDGSWTKSYNYKPSNNANVSYTSTDMKEGSKYSFRVKAINSTHKTESSWSKAVEYTHKKNTTDDGGTTVKKPSAPTGLKVTWTANTTCKVSWSKVSDAVKYEVEYKVGDGSWTKSYNYKPSDNANVSYTSSDMKDGSKYSFRVKAINTAGDSAWTTVTYTHKKPTSTTPTDPKPEQPKPETPKPTEPEVTKPANPTGLKVTRAGTTTAKVAWTKVTGATSYEVEYKAGSGSWTKSYNYTDNKAVSYTSADMGDGVAYSFRVRAVNTAGKSGWTEVNYTHKKYVVPSKPTDLKVTRAGATTAKVSWTKATNAVTYEVEYKVGDGSWNKSYNYSDNKATSYTSTDMGDGVKYSFRVRAVSPAGKSDWVTVTYTHKN